MFDSLRLVVVLVASHARDLQFAWATELDRVNLGANKLALALREVNVAKDRIPSRIVRGGKLKAGQRTTCAVALLLGRQVRLQNTGAARKKDVRTVS